MTRWRQALLLAALMGSVSTAAQDAGESDSASPADADFYQTSATSVILGSISEDQAVRIAKEQARRRIISQALGTEISCRTTVEDFRLASSFCAEAARGITVNESWTVDKSLEDNTFLVTVSLKAQVRELTREKAPTIEVFLEDTTVETGEPIEITVEAADEAYIALYNRFSDEAGEERVVRIFPFDDAAAVRLSAGQRLKLPPEGYLFTAQSRPNREQDLDVIVVIASSRPFQSTWYADNVATDRYQEAVAGGIAYNRFIAALDRADLAQIDIVNRPIVVKSAVAN